MRIIRSGTKYSIFDSSIETFEQLPAKTFLICFNQNEGYFLRLCNNPTVNEKVYGIQKEKAGKVMRSFSSFSKSLGIILSGDKGIGKSLFAKRLCNEALKIGLPVLIVDQNLPGLARFIDSIEQECVVLFDEFDKLFRSDDDEDEQQAFLSLFDGVSSGKKLFIVTCNYLYGLNDFLINRPGRFHYHFRFDYPSAEEIREYLEDNVVPEYQHQIKEVIGFSNKVTLNYDCLRAIAFELNMGTSFREAIADLNILNVEQEEYNLILHFKGGKELHFFGYKVNLFDQDRTYNWVYMYNDSGNDVARLRFDKVHVSYDVAKNEVVIPAKGLLLDFSNYDDDPEAKEFMDLEVSHLSFIRRGLRSLHYAV